MDAPQDGRRLFAGAASATILLGVLLACPSPAHAVPVTTAPQGDLGGDGEVTTADLQCLLLVQTRIEKYQPLLFDLCATDAQCANGDHCGLAFGVRICLPSCVNVAAGITIGDDPDVECADPAADTATCKGLVQKRSADLDCDGAVTNVDFQFVVAILMGQLGGSDTPDIDGDGVLNFCDPDSDGDGDPDLTDCALLDPNRGHANIETCDLVDNDCDGLVDTDDSSLQGTCCATEADCFDDNVCTSDACQIVGGCLWPAVDGPCDDASACTEGDACASGSCVSGPAATCDDGKFCTEDGCDPATGCTFVEGGGPCDDGNPCTSGDTCGAGQCAGTGGTDCDDGEPCTVDTCLSEAGGCQHTADACDDQSLCTTDSCAAGAGCQHEPVVCGDGDLCTLDLCTPASGCAYTLVSCDDVDACTTDSCDPAVGICENTLTSCDDGDGCTIDSCDSATGCITAPDSCSDGVLCTVDTCTSTGGVKSCAHEPLDEACDDDLFCNGAETCDPSAGCAPGEAPASDDGVECTDDLCDEDTGAFLHIANPAICDDGKACSGVEACSLTEGCQPGDLADDGVACTVDSCSDSGGGVTHTPDASACDDGVACTTDGCDASIGCTHTVSPAWCAIGGGCIVQGALNPANASESCDPLLTQVAWTSRVSVPEVCNGLDDDFDGKTDEDASGNPMTRACANACAAAGVETCSNGGYSGCTAPVVQETCGDDLDNDCDSATDEDACAGGDKPPVPCSVMSFTATLGEVENIDVDLGNARYRTKIQDLANPNLSGGVRALSYGSLSAAVAYNVVGLAPASIQLVALRDTLYADAAEARFAVKLADKDGRPPPTGTSVTATMSGAASGAATCSTNAAGNCTAAWVAPPSAFASSGSITAQVTAGGLPPVTRTLAVVAKPAALAIPKPGVGIELPLSPRFPSTTFSVPVHVDTNGAELGTYDLWLTFDPAKLQVTSVAKGTCGALDSPVHNQATANTTGLLKFNALNVQAGAACATGAKVHAATLTFEVKAGLLPDDAASVATLVGTVKTLTDIGNQELAKDQPIAFGDALGSGTTGHVTAWSRAVRGILASVSDVQLLNWKPLTGSAETVQVGVMAWRRDFTSVSVAADPGAVFETTDATIAAVSTSGLVSPGTASGHATIAVTYGGFASTARLRVLQPGPLVIALSDTDLQAIDGTVAGTLQHAELGARLPWLDGEATVWTQDVTSHFDADDVVLPPGVLYDELTHVLAASAAGVYTITLKGALGNDLGTATFKVSPTASVSCTELLVVAPCDVQILSLNPPSPTAEVGFTEPEAGVYGFLTAYHQTCQAHVYAKYADGTREEISGFAGVTLSSDSAQVATSTTAGLITAVSGGEANITADWNGDGGALVCTGTTQVVVDLPKPIAVVASPKTLNLAMSDGDPAATVKGLPASQQISVTVVYEDGSSLDFTAHETTVYDATSLDPSGLVVASATGLVESTGAGAGPAKVLVSVAQYPMLGGDEVVVNVIKADAIAGEVYETYSPSQPKVTDHRLSWIEGTTTRQDALYQVMMTFSDGTAADVTSVAAVETATPGIVAFEPATAKVTPGAAGLTDVTFSYGALSATLAGFEVADDMVNVALLFPALKSGTTFSGIRDVGTTTMETWCLFADGTRRRLDGTRTIDGLLTYASSFADAATIDAAGVATIRGNKTALFTVDLAPALDSGATYDGAEVSADCNLLASAGDIDFGDTSGLAFKPVAPNTTFTIQARINTGGKALGAFDLTIAATGLSAIEADGATVGSIFSANPAEGLVNASFNPLSGIKIGANIAIFKITLTSDATGAYAVDGSVTKVVALDGKTTIGPPTPRGIVAGYLPCTGNTTCNDTNPCTDDQCQSGKCVHLPISDVPCSDDSDVCTSDICNEGACTHPAIPGCVP